MEVLVVIHSVKSQNNNSNYLLGCIQVNISKGLFVCAFCLPCFSTIYFLLQVKQLLSHFLLNPQHGILVKGLLQDFEGSRPRLMCIRVVEIISFPSPCMLCKNSQPREVASIIFLLLQELVFPFSTTFQNIFQEFFFVNL